MFTPESRLVRCRAALLSTAAAVLSLAFAAGAHAAPIVITFDAGDPIGGLPVGTTLANQYAALGVSFEPNAFSGAGGPSGEGWATNTDMTIVSSTGSDVGGLGTPLLVSGNLLRSFNGWLAEDGDASFRAIFGGIGVSTFSATFAGIATPSSTRIFAYNGITLLDSAIATTLTGQQTLTVSSATPITSVVLTPGDFNDWVGVDNITFERIQQVPEPTSMVLLGAGLAGAAIARRRRR